MNFRIKYIVSISVMILLMLIFSNTKNIAQVETTNLQKLTESSEIILLGKVTDTQSEWNENRDRIYTKVRIKADEFIKGNNSSADIIITIPGGEVGDVGELYSDLPTFELKEEVLLFANRDNENNYVINNGLEGKYNISNDEKAGIKMNGKLTSIQNIKDKIKSIIGSRQ